jgi:DNA-directed RNA polymerase specialized sigma24 family protein
MLINPSWIGGAANDFCLGAAGIHARGLSLCWPVAGSLQIAPGKLAISCLAYGTMNTDRDLQSEHLNDLRQHCAEQSARFFQRQDHDSRFCFELFRRAINNHAEDAWEYLYQQYKPLVAGWVENNATFHVLDEEKEFFVNRAFEKMWGSISPEKFARFSDLAAVLRYLKMCVASVIIDHARAQARPQVENSLDALDGEAQRDSPGLEQLVLDRVGSQEFWHRIRALISNKTEYRVLYGSFVLGLKPREVLENYPEEFKDVREIYRVKENLLARLRRSQELVAHLASYTGENL